MPNDPYLDASVAWRIRNKNIDFRESGYHETVQSILENGLATRVRGMISSGKEASVYLAEHHGAPIAVKVYRLYQTSHKGGRPIKLNSAGWLAAHEYDMLLQAWKGGAPVPTPSRRVENMLTMRYLDQDGGPAPRLQDIVPDDPAGMLEMVARALLSLGRAGVVHTDLSPYNILVKDGRPWFIDLSEALRVDRTGDTPWIRLTEAERALRNGISSLDRYFGRFDLRFDESIVPQLIGEWDRFGVMG
ncbi:RIO1 family protein [anaerobic digester metagenome]|jgi:RIO kinase 1|nr:phosphotransferase [Methanomassiliicoccales archaeon]